MIAISLIAYIVSSYLMFASAIMVSHCHAQNINMAPKPTHILTIPQSNDINIIKDGWIGYSRDGKYFAAYYTLMNKGYYLTIWECSTWKTINTIKIESGIINNRFGPTCAYDLSGTKLILLTYGKINLYPLQNTDKISIVDVIKFGKEGDAADSAFMFVGNDRIARFSFDSGRLWRENVQIGNSSKILTTNEEFEQPFAISFNEQLGIFAWTHQVALGNPYIVYLREIKTDKEKKTATNKLSSSTATANFSSLQFNNTGSMIACGGFDGSLLLWDIVNKKQKYFTPNMGKGKIVTSISFNAQNSLIAYGNCDDKGIHNTRVISLSENIYIYSWSDNGYGVRSLCFKPSSNQLAVLGGKSINIYDIEIKKNE